MKAYTHLECANYEKRMTKGKELEVLEDLEPVKSFCIEPTLSDNYIMVYLMGKWVIYLLLTYRMDSGSQDPCTMMCHTNIPT